MRTPLGGRGFECFSEDPELTARLAVSYVAGLQSAGVGAAVKHYVGNDSETDRWTYDAQIPENVLRELYLVPFEACVREAGAWLIMAAYNSVNGERMTDVLGILEEHSAESFTVRTRDGQRVVIPRARAVAGKVVPPAPPPRRPRKRPESS